MTLPRLSIRTSPSLVKARMKPLVVSSESELSRFGGSVVRLSVMLLFSASTPAACVIAVIISRTGKINTGNRTTGTFIAGDVIDGSVQVWEVICGRNVLRFQA
jgi:hypothetical protein